MISITLLKNGTHICLKYYYTFGVKWAYLENGCQYNAINNQMIYLFTDFIIVGAMNLLLWMIYNGVESSFLSVRPLNMNHSFDPSYEVMLTLVAPSMMVALLLLTA